MNVLPIQMVVIKSSFLLQSSPSPFFGGLTNERHSYATYHPHPHPHRVGEHHSAKRPEVFSQAFMEAPSASRHAYQSHSAFDHHRPTPAIKRRKLEHHPSDHLADLTRHTRHTSETHSSRHHSGEPVPSLPKSNTCLYCDRRFRSGNGKSSTNVLCSATSA